MLRVLKRNMQRRAYFDVSSNTAKALRNISDVTHLTVQSVKSTKTPYFFILCKS